MKTKVLVVDDSEMVLEATQMVLEDAGLDVVTLSSPALFPVTLNRQKPDLVLLDVGMPIMGGDSLVELARKNQLHQCPIVLYSDRSEKSLQALAIACGAQGYVKKTSDPAQLMAAVQKFLPVVSEGAPQSDEVFLVDDQRMIRALLEEHLRRAGVTPVLLDSAEKCLQLAEARPPAMIIFDLNLAGMRGDDACRKLRANPRLRAIPVVIMTARTKPSEVLRWWECGADDFIPKPVRPDQLEAKIRAVRGQRPAMGAEKGQKVLLAVADNSARNRIGLILECSGYRVRYASTAHEAKAAIEDGVDTFDASVFDAGLLMPEWQPLLDKLRSKIRWTLWMIPAELPSHVRKAVAAGDSWATVEHHLGPELVLARLNILCKRVAADLRAVERVAFYAGVEFRREPQAPWDCGFAHDLSPAGLFVRTLTPAPKGSTIEFRVLDQPEGASIEGRALVAWSNEYGQRTTYSYPVGMGLQLNALDGLTQKRAQAAYDAAKKASQGARVIAHVLPIRVREEWYAVEATACEQVLGDAAWLPLRHRGSAVRGVYFWRRQALSVVDLTLGQGPSPWTLAPRLVILKGSGRGCALLCEEVREAVAADTVVEHPHAFGGQAIRSGTATWPLITVEGLGARLSEELSGSPATFAGDIGAAVLFQVGPVDIAVPASLVEHIGTAKAAAVLDPKATLELPAYEELDDDARTQVVCNVSGRRISIVAEGTIRMVEGADGHAVNWPRFTNADRPAPTWAVLGWGRRPAILLEEQYLNAYLEVACP